MVVSFNSRLESNKGEEEEGEWKTAITSGAAIQDQGLRVEGPEFGDEGQGLVVRGKPP